MHETFLEQVARWGEEEPSVRAVVLVGSVARGTQTRASDIDLCILTDQKRELVAAPDFIRLFGTVEKTRMEYYGACTSVRVWYKEGIEAEFGLVEPSWISRPLDSGTAQVLRGGYRVLVDKERAFESLPL